MSDFSPAVFAHFIQTSTFNGVTFYNMDPLLKNVRARTQAMTTLANMCKPFSPTCILGIESRGYGLAAHLADALGCGWTMARKAGKTPGDVERISYSVEYGSTRELELTKNLYTAADRVLIVDDVLATGGTAQAMGQLVERCGGTVAGYCFLIEINGLGGRGRCESCGPSATLLTLELGEVTPFDPSFSIPDVVDSFAVTPPVESTVTPVVPPVESTASASTMLPIPPLAKSKKIVVMSHTSTRRLARQLIQIYPAVFDEALIQWDYFPDGTPNIHFERELENRDVVFIGSLYNTNKILEQSMLTMVLPRQHVRSLTILYPYNSMGTMDRVDEAGTLATADTLAATLTRMMPLTKSGPPTLCMFDIHTLHEQFYFPDTVRPCLLSGLGLMQEYLGKEMDDMVVVFPDDGAAKRFGRAFTTKNPTTPMIVCAKVRDGDKRRITIKDRMNMIDGKPYTKAIIVDDLVQTGGTLYECMLALKADGFVNVSAYVTHAVFPKKCYKDFLPGGSKSGFYRFYVTDSIPEVAYELPQGLFEVIPLMPMFGRKVMAITDREDEFERSLTDQTCCVLVGTMNDGKLGAVMDAMSFVGFVPEVTGVGSRSGVNAQPIGADEIMRGAHNRACHAFDRYAPGRDGVVFAVGIESGLVLPHDSSDSVSEYVGIEIIGPSMTYSQLFKSIDISDEFLPLIDRVKESPETLTFGKLIQKPDGVTEDNWHTIFKLDRYDQMRRFIIQMLIRWQV
jgi:adenine phosphoribosyltransferase